MELKYLFYCLGNKSLSSKLPVETYQLKPTRDYKTFHNIVKLMTAKANKIESLFLNYCLLFTSKTLMNFSEREPLESTIWRYLKNKRSSSVTTLQIIIPHNACLAEWKNSFKILKIAKVAKSVFLESKWFLKDIAASLFGQTVNQKTQHICLIFQSTL